ncbi:MAG: signal peptidase II [Oscillospiraceae bacterium]|nr:signal peptidase II [Oscillospiraceae bacterium]
MLYAIIAVLVLIADQWLKYWVNVTITLDTGSQTLIPGVVKLVHIHNSGAAFGILDNVPFARWILLGLALVLCIVVIVLIIKKVFPSRFATWCMVLFMAGALGNCIDRSLYGYVVDMFKLEFVSFAVFNVADIFLTVSCLLFIIYLFVGGKDEDKYDEASPRARSEAENPLPADDDVWSSFRNDISSAPRRNSAAPAPAPAVAPVSERRDGRRSAVIPAVTESPVAEELPVPPAEPAPVHTPVPVISAETPETETPAAPAAGGSDFSLEDILREFS